MDGRYEVSLFWKTKDYFISDNRDMVVKRFKNTERRFFRELYVVVEYNKTIERYIEKGYIRKVV